MSFTTISATTLGLADGDQSPTPVSGTVRITPRHPAGTTTSGGVIATGPVIVTVTGGAFPSTAVPAREDSTALVEFHLYTTDGPVRMPDTEIPLTPGATINLRDHLPIAIDPATGRGLARGDDGPGLTDIIAENGQITMLWDGGGSRTIDVPDAVQGVGVQDATQPAAGVMALTLTDGSTTSQVTLPDGPPGRDGSNVLPTGVAIAQAIGPDGVARGALDTAIEQLAVTSPSVGRIITSTDPAEPLADGEVLLVYQGPRTWTERFDDGLWGLTPRGTNRDHWTWNAGAVTIPQETRMPARRGLSFDSLGDRERDVELLARVHANGTTSAVNTGLFLRGDPQNGVDRCFAVCLMQAGFWVISYTPTGATVLTNQSLDRRVDVDIMIRFRADDRLRARVWHADDPEPDTWQYDDVIVGSTGPGLAGLYSNTSTNLFSQRWLEVAVATQGGTAVLS